MDQNAMKLVGENIEGSEAYVIGTFDFAEYEGTGLTCWLTNDTGAQEWASVALTSNYDEGREKVVQVVFYSVNDPRFPGRKEPRLSLFFDRVSIVPNH